MTLEPDRDQLEIFIDAIFRRASPQGFVAIRSFFEGQDKVSRLSSAAMSGGLRFLMDVAEDDARRAAQNPEPVCFAPPLAIFTNKEKAREEDIAEGLTISVECDENPHQARATLEELIGAATVVVKSGGSWINGGEAEDKLHLHWRLKKPAKRDDLAKLKQARILAAAIVGADPTTAPINHPLRWPGSWHRKAEPRLCRIVALDADREIDLDAVLDELIKAAPQQAKHDDAHANKDNQGDWPTLVGNITTGKSYHAPLVSLAARLVGSGCHDGTTVNLLRATMAASTAEHDQRWRTRFESIPRIVRSARDKFTKENEPPQHTASGIDFAAARGTGDPATDDTPVTFCDLQAWSEREPPPRQWAVLDRFPLRNVALFSGEGAIGKSILLMQLGVAHVLGKAWLNTLPEPGPFLYLNAEEEDDELHRRLAAITTFYDASLTELKNDLHLFSRAGQDAVLGYPDRNGLVKATPLFAKLKEAACDIKPKLIGLDTAADIFAGNENDRSQVRQFIGLLRNLAITANTAVIVCTHPSIGGIDRGTGLSGSTAWHNSVRARAYMHAVKIGDDIEPDKDLRQIEFMKSNYGPIAATVTVRWKAGVFVLEPKGGSLQQLAHDAKADDVFLQLLDRFTRQGRVVGDRKGTSYAPAAFHKEAEAKTAGLTSEALAESMRRLFASNRIHVENYGRPSRPSLKLVLGPAPDDQKADTPTSAGAEPDPTPALPANSKVLSVAPGQRCELCGSGRDVHFIQLPDERQAAPRHKRCAAQYWERTREKVTQ
jgi:RecA-family ATPase